jgi:hypothetical protein
VFSPLAVSQVVLPLIAALTLYNHAKVCVEIQMINFMNVS